MGEVQIVHTADLSSAARAAALALLGDVFAGELTEDDWEHALGGVHGLVWDGEQLVGHAAVVQRRVLHDGRALRTGYVEAVGVRADRRRRGHGEALMRAMARIIRGAYELGALGATDEAVGLYARLGWQRWQGPTSALTPDGVMRTPDADGAVYVLPVRMPLDRRGALTCDWREGDVW